MVDENTVMRSNKSCGESVTFRVVHSLHTRHGQFQQVVGQADTNHQTKPIWPKRDIVKHEKEIYREANQNQGEQAHAQLTSKTARKNQLHYTVEELRKPTAANNRKSSMNEQRTKCRRSAIYKRFSRRKLAWQQAVPSIPVRRSTAHDGPRVVSLPLDQLRQLPT